MQALLDNWVFRYAKYDVGVFTR